MEPITMLGLAALGAVVGKAARKSECPVCHGSGTNAYVPNAFLRDGSPNRYPQGRTIACGHCGGNGYVRAGIAGVFK